MKKSIRSGALTIAAIIVLGLVALLIYQTLIVQKIADVKTEENVGEKVIVRGEVKTVVKIGSLSGYTLEDESGTIAVSSDNLPEEGETLTVKGTLMREILLGYYIKAD